MQIFCKLKRGQCRNRKEKVKNIKARLKTLCILGSKSQKNI